jgi:hypothetical protein
MGNFFLIVYYVSGAASIAGSLTLDGGGIQIQLLLLRLMALPQLQTQTLF